MPPRRVAKPSAKAGRGGAGAGPRVRHPSLRELYLKSCAEHGIHPNSGVIELLPEKPGTAFASDTLDVSRNYLGDKGLLPLLAAAERMSHLRAIVVAENGLRNRGVEALCRVAMTHPSLTYLDLSDNYISEGAARSVEQLLTENQRITDVVIENTKIDVTWRVRLQDRMEANRSAVAAATTATDAQKSGSPPVAASA